MGNNFWGNPICCSNKRKQWFDTCTYPQRLPLFPFPGTVTATAPASAHVLAKWQQAAVIAATMTPHKPTALPPLQRWMIWGPLGSAQRHGCSTVKQKRRTERGPYWLLFNFSEWHYWNPHPVCVHVWRQLGHTCLLCMPDRGDQIGKGGGECVHAPQTSCFTSSFFFFF